MMAARSTAERTQRKAGGSHTAPGPYCMVTIYHNLDPDAPRRVADPAVCEAGRVGARELELAAVVSDTDDLAEAFDQVIHRDGENWTDNAAVTRPAGPAAAVFAERCEPSMKSRVIGFGQDA